MIIDKLENKDFIGFASKVVKANLEYFLSDLTLTRGKHCVELKVYLGGESEDSRMLKFKDEGCVYINGRHQEGAKDISRIWIQNLIDTSSLNADEKKEIVFKYNRRLDNQVAKYKQMIESEKFSEDYDFSCNA